MTERLYSYPDLEYSNKLDKLEEEADKLNELTFNSEIPWEYDEVELDNDNFKSFEFDNKIEESENRNKIIDSNNELKYEQSEQQQQSTDDLLGLTGSLINFQIFQCHENDETKRNKKQSSNNFKDLEFETAFNKLDFVEQTLLEDVSAPAATTTTTRGEEIEESKEQVQVPLESPFDQLTKFSDVLFQQFQQQKSQSNIHALNQIVSIHLNQLKKQLELLNLSMTVLPDLKYFQFLMRFIAIDNKLTEIQTKYSNNPLQLNHEISLIIQYFSIQSPQQQIELSSIHPFYTNLMSMLTAGVSPAVGGGHKERGRESRFPEWLSEDERKQYESRYRNSDRSQTSWMSESERDWLIKIQTRNLVTDNPYVHDYYYTQHTMRQMSEARARELSTTGHTSICDPLSLLPSPITGDQLGAGIDPNKDGLSPGQRPVQFENSLGMVAPSNLNTPRQTIQLSPSVAKRPVPIASSSSYQLVRQHRELLGLIEKMYSIVLRIDEVDKSLARMLVEQHKSRGVLLQHRGYLLQLLIDCLIGGGGSGGGTHNNGPASVAIGNNNNDRLVKYFSVPKGARIFVSALAIVSPGQFVQLTRALFFNSISIYQSECFPDICHDLRSVIVSRVRNLTRDELALMLSIMFSSSTGPASSPTESGVRRRLQPIVGFCTDEFGLSIILTLLDSFLKSDPEEKAQVIHWLSITIKSTDNQTYLKNCMKDYKSLFPSNDRR